MFFKKLVIIQILASAVFFSTAAAAPLTFNVDGVISDSSDQPLQSASVTFTVQVKDSAETCLLYQESFPVSMTGSNGYFSLVVGKQTNAVSGGSTLDKVFSNSGAAIPGQSCTYTPTLKTETRKIIVSFDEGSGSQIFSSQEIQSVPYAVAAGEATKFTGSLSGDVTGSQTAAVVGKIKGLPVDTTGIADGKILKYQSGSFVVSDDLQGTSGIVSLNGLTGGTQTFSAVDITGSVLAPAWVSSGSAHTLKIPMASGTSVTGGLISNSDFANFSTKITALTGDITASGSGTVNAVIGTGKVTSSHILDGTINGADVDFTATNSATSDLVLKDSGTGKFATFTCSTPNYVLTWTAAGWSCQAPATTGLPLSGGTMTGAINMGGNNLLNVGNLTMVSGGYLSLPNTAINGASAGQVWYDAGVIKYYDGSAVKTVNTGSSGMSNTLSTGQIWVGNVSGGAEARSLNGDISSTSATGAVVVNKTTTGTANTILSLDGSSVGTMSGLALVNTGTVTVSASSASSTYNLKLPAAAPTGTQVMQVDATGNLTWIATPSFTMPALSAGKIWIGNASNGIAAQTMGGDATIDNAGVLTLKNTGAIGTYTKVITDAQGRVTSGLALTASDVTTALTYTPLNKAADTMSGDLGTQNINMAANKYLKLSANSTDGTVAGQVWYDAGIIKYYDGTTVKSLGVAGAGITNFNGLSAASQTLTVGTSGNAPAFSSATSTHTLNIPMASASGSVTAGLISNGDYVSFAGKQNNALTAGSVWVGNSSGGAQARTLGGDITIDNAGIVTLKNTGTVGTYFRVITDAQGRVISGGNLAAGDITTALGYTPANGAGSFINGGNLFSGNATIGLNDAFNLGFKTNNVTQMTLTSGGSLGIGTTNPGAYKTLIQGSAGNILGVTDGTAAAAIFADNAASGVAQIQFGSTTNHSLGFFTNNAAPSLTISTTGKVGIGVNAPAYSLDFTGKTDSIRLPSGTTAQRSGAALGQIRFNTSLNAIEYSNNSSTWVSLGNALGYTPLNIAGDTMSGALGLGANDITNTGNITMAANKYLTLSSNSTSGTTAGQMWYDSTGNVIKYYDGTAAKTLGVAGAGITSLNGLSTATQTFGVGTIGSDLNISSSGNGHIFNLPSASASNRGALTSTDWSTFNAKQSSLLPSGQVWVGNASGASEARALSGDIASVSNVGLVTVDKTTTGQANKLLALDGTGVANVKGLDIQTGTSKVTLQTNGAFTNYVLTLPNAQGGANQVLSNDGAGNLGWVTPLTSSTGFVNGGNTFAGNATIGLNDAYNLGFKTNSTTRMTITAAGNVGIGTTSPSYSLDFNGKTDAIRLPAGTTAQRPTATAGLFRYNSSNLKAEFSEGTTWYSLQNDLGYTPLNKAGDTMTGALNMNSSNITAVNMIGVGTASPSYSLDFVGKTDAIRLPSGTTAQQPANAAGLLRYNTTNNNVEFNNGSAWTAFNTGGGALPAIASAQVWVGNTSAGPEARTLSGDVTISNVGLVTLKNTGTIGTYTKVITDAQGRVTFGSALASGDVTTALGFAPANGTTAFANGGNLFSGNATIGLNDNFNLGFKTNNTTRMTLTGAGNLGIGTATPGAYRTLIQGTTGTNVLGITDGTATAAFYVESGLTPSAPVQLGTTSNHNLGFFTNNTAPTMTLSTGGNLGIGVDSANYSLDISGRTDAIRLPMGTTAQRPAGNVTGLLRYNTANLNLEFNNGSTWTSLGASGGITALNGLTGTTQTLANSVSGTTPAFVSTGSTHTLNIPMANTSSVTAGLISKTEYDTFNSKLNGTLASGNIFVGNASGGAVGVGMSGDATIATNGTLTVTKTTTGQANKILSLDGSGVATMLGLNLVNSGTVTLQAQTASSNYVLRLPASSPSANQIMVSDASGNLSWASNPSLGYTPVNKAGDTMTGTLEVSGNIQTNQGQVYASQNLVSTGGTVDFNTGNVQILQAPGGATITLNNMKDGGSYTVIVADPTSRQYTFTNCTNPHFVPANDLTTAGAQSIYTILKVTIGGATHCYISWVTGF